MRAPISAVGPLLQNIQEDLGLSNVIAGSMTTIPLVAFALLSPLAPRWAEKYGMERTVFFAFLFIVVGIILRIYPDVTFLLVGTLFVGMAIAICNVLLPPIMKQNFPLHIGLMTGIYGLVMNIAAAISSGISEPLATVLNWNGALAIWGVTSILAVCIWSYQLRRKQKEEGRARKVNLATTIRLSRSRLAWYVTAFMGLQSFIYYTVLTWLPQLLVTYGYSSISAGWMLATMQAALFPMTFIIPIIAAKMKNQRALSVLTGLAFLLSSIGLLSGIWLPVWVLLMGVACGNAFGLAMMFFSLRTIETSHAARLSGMAQSLGYLLAALGPVLFGIVYELFHSWSAPLLILVTASFLLCFIGYLAGDGFVEKDR